MNGTLKVTTEIKDNNIIGEQPVTRVVQSKSALKAAGPTAFGDSSFGWRLCQVLEEKGIKQIELARMLQVKQQTVHYLCNVPAPVGTSRYITSIADVLGINPVWLQAGIGDRLNPFVNIQTIGGGNANMIRIPLLSQEDVEAHCAGQPNRARTLLFTDALSDESAFALEIQDQSMSPSLGMGDRIVFDTTTKVRPGDVVCALLNGDVLIRRYKLKSQSQLELAPSNPDWSSVFCDVSGQGAARILGVMTERRCYRRGL